MGIHVFVIYFIEVLLFSLYFAFPLFMRHSDFIQNDFHHIFAFRQSLSIIPIQCLIRTFFFTYIRRACRHIPATRCFVFIVFLEKSILTALSYLQFVIYQQDSRSFLEYRKIAWGKSYVLTLWSLIFVASILELVYILRLNKGRGHEDDSILKDLLLLNVNHSNSTKQDVWRKKWAQLIKQFKRKQNEPTFSALVRLYAHREGAVERLDIAHSRDPVEFEFYLPQICSFLMLGAFVQSPQLSAILLDKCTLSHVFAHKMLWYLQSYCSGNSSLARGGNIESLHALMDQVQKRGVVPARAIDQLRAGFSLPVEVDSSALDRVTLALSIKDTHAIENSKSAHAAEQEIEALLPSREDQYATFNDFSILDVEGADSAHGDPFQRENQFLHALADISSKLLSVAYRARNDKLHEWLSNIQAEYLPSNSLYLPVSNPFHRLKRIHVSESFTFSTRERVPFLLCAEVIDYVSPHIKHVPKKRSSIFRARPFALGIWDKSAQNQDIVQPEKAVPEAHTLGFWSQSHNTSSPRHRQLKHSFSQPTEMLNGFLESLVSKIPRKDSTRDNAVHSNSTESVTTPRYSLTRADTFGNDDKASTNDLVYSPPRLDALAIDIENSQDEPNDEDDWSPRSELISPQSLHTAHSPGSASSTHLKGRCDSTDHLLQQLSERDSKLVEEEDDATVVSRKKFRKEPSHVIFKERWADKEARLRIASNWGHLPGWRLIPVIIKSNDDLRQEQFAAQLLKQFYIVFEEAKLPVFMRPYDVIAISPSSGIVEAIADTISIHSLKQNVRAGTTLLDFFIHRFGDPSSSEFRKARNNFVCSMASYSIVSYLLQIKDRHNGNLLLDAEGHIIHIDFGFILSNNPGNVAFENAPFKLTNEFVQLMGGPRSASFRRFRSLCVRAFLVARKYRHRFLLLVEMMMSGNEHLPCFAGDPKGTMERLAARFQPQLDINACEDFVHDLIDDSLNNWRTKWYDKYQRWCVGVF